MCINTEIEIDNLEREVRELKDQNTSLQNQLDKYKLPYRRDKLISFFKKNRLNVI